MNAARSNIPTVGIGETMRGLRLGRVVSTRHAGFAAGDLALGLLGWQDYGVAPGAELETLGRRRRRAVPGTGDRRRRRCRRKGANPRP